MRNAGASGLERWAKAIGTMALLLDLPEDEQYLCAGMESGMRTRTLYVTWNAHARVQPAA